MQPATSFEKFSDWDSCYFWGLTTTPPAELNFDSQQLGYLLNLANCDAAISSLAALEPRHVINHKGTTVWAMLFLSLLVNDKEGLQAVAEGKAGICVPVEAVRGAYGGHINWPAEMLRQYSYDFGKHTPFIVPFVRHRSAPEIKQFERSMKSPDGKVEIMGVGRFDEEFPQTLLSLIHNFSGQFGAQFRQSQ
ncbi:MAG TPA: hypothetical protein VF472_06465 [Burkholderiaceae bacterium]